MRRNSEEKVKEHYYMESSSSKEYLKGSLYPMSVSGGFSQGSLEKL